MSMSNPIELSIQEQQPMQQQPMQQQPIMSIGDQQTISQLVSGIQRASLSGATALPSAHIGFDQTPFTHDEQSMNPNYVPQPQPMVQTRQPMQPVQPMFQQQHQNIQQILHEAPKQSKLMSLVWSFHDNCWTILVLCVLFFVFQLPFIKHNLLQLIPQAFKADGNYTLLGLIVVSVTFGFVHNIATMLPMFISG